MRHKEAFMKIVLHMALLMILLEVKAFAQDALLYAAVVSNAKYIVGAANEPTGLMISLDLGKNWMPTQWSNCRAFDVAVDEGSSGHVMYIACGNGVLKTTDAGRHWRLMTGWEITEVQDICVNAKDRMWISIGTAYGVWVSGNGGETWEARNAMPCLFCSALETDREDDQTVWVGTEEGVFSSVDRGRTWASGMLKGLPVRAIAQNPHDSSMLMAGTEGHGIFISHDRGLNWHPSGNGLHSITVYDIAFDGKNPHCVFAATHGKGVWVSEDLGRHWQKRNRGLANEVVHALATAPGSGWVFAGAIYGGVYRSSDAGITWEPAGLGNAQVWSLELLRGDSK